MPKAFDDCVKKGGKVRTKSLSDGRYIHICFLNGKSFAGHVKKKSPNAGEKEMRNSKVS